MKALRIATLSAILLCLIPNATAVNGPSAPPTVIVDLIDWRSDEAGNWVSFWNVTFENSPDDPGDGSWHYWVNLSPDTSICSSSFCYHTQESLYTEMGPARPGWSWLAALTTGASEEDANTEKSTWAFRNMTLFARNDTAGVNGSASCQVSLDFKAIETGFIFNFGNDGAVDTLHHKVPNEAGIVPYYACGSNMSVADPLGVQALVMDDYATGNGTSTTNVSWIKSTDDPDFLSLDYYVLRRYNNPPFPGSTLFWNLDSTTDGIDNATLHSHWITGSGTNGTRDNVWVQVLARDNLTHQRGVGSCVVNVIQGVNGSAAGCGALSGFGSTLPTAPTPSFPGLDVAAWTTATGLNSDAAGWLLAAFLILLLAVGGSIIAKGWGAGIAASLGLGWGYHLGLVQPWIIIVVFMLAATVVVLMYDRGSGGGP